jgi:hypothetical protein
MPHDPVIESQEVVFRTGKDTPDRVVLNRYEAPATPDSGIAEDPYKASDLAACAQAMRTLEKHYPGHCFRVIHDSKQGICLMSIPILMGINNYMAVNLKTHALDDSRVMKAGGEILERYGLKRGGFELTPFLDARAKHSALVVPSRKVPG